MSRVYSSAKIFHFKYKLDSLPKTVEGILAPVHIRIKPTNVCNHNCSYCAYKSENLKLGKNMIKRDFIPKEKMMEIIDDIVEMGVKAVTFSGGGEPFCYPYLYDAARKLSSSPVKFASLTNGSLLEGKTAEIFAHKAKWIRISIDGWDDKSYSNYRKVRRGEFTRVMTNIRRFKRYGGRCYLGVSIIVDRDNSSHICGLIRELKDNGADSVKISPCIVNDDVGENNRYHKKIFKEVKKQILTARGRIDDDKFEFFDAYHEQMDPFKKEYAWCPYLQVLPIIGADLNVYPCQDKAYTKDGLIGSIAKIRFKDFWFSGKKKFFKINPSKVCNNHCVANAKNKMILEYLNIDREHMEFV